MSAPQLFGYSPISRELVGAVAAEENPEVVGEYLVPAWTTEAAPPVLSAGHAAVFSDGAWSLVEDRRGETWYRADGAEVLVEQLGEPTSFDPPLSVAPPVSSPAETETVPEQISRRQFYQGLAIEELISEDEAIGAVAGVIPPPITTILGGLSVNQQFPAKMLLAGAATFERHHPLVETFAAAEGKDAAWLDRFWTTYALI